MAGFFPGKDEHAQSPHASFVSACAREIPLCAREIPLHSTDLSRNILRTPKDYGTRYLMCVEDSPQT